MKERRSRVVDRKKFFTVSVVGHWNRLHSEVVDVPSLEVYKARLDGAASSLVLRVVSLPIAGSWNYVILTFPSKPNHSMIL